MSSKLIVFEGIDNSGKTSISQEVVKHLKGEWLWSKEPGFTTEEADMLNDKSRPMDESAREVLFLSDRLRKQAFYAANNVVLDRYLWTGMAYAKVFSPSISKFTDALYQDHSIFKKPDVYVFVDTPVALCHEREPAVSIERLNAIRDAYYAALSLQSSPVLYASGEGSLEQNVKQVLNLLNAFFLGDYKESLVMMPGEVQNA